MLTSEFFAWYVRRIMMVVWERAHTSYTFRSLQMLEVRTGSSWTVAVDLPEQLSLWLSLFRSTVSANLPYSCALDSSRKNFCPTVIWYSDRPNSTAKSQFIHESKAIPDAKHITRLSVSLSNGEWLSNHDVIAFKSCHLWLGATLVTPHIRHLCPYLYHITSQRLNAQQQTQVVQEQTLQGCY